MKYYQTTLTHKQHKENKMTELEQIEAQAQADRQTKIDKYNGLTRNAKVLKKLCDIAGKWTSGVSVEGGNGAVLPWNPKQARRVQALQAVRSELMSDPKEFFGTLDIRVIRNNYEYESLNHRQKKNVDNQYGWMHNEAVEADIPALKNDIWYAPLQAMYDSLTEKEKENITAEDRMSIMDHLELKGTMKQPRYVGSNEAGDPLFEIGMSILDVEVTV